MGDLIDRQSSSVVTLSEAIKVDLKLCKKAKKFIFQNKPKIANKFIRMA